MTRQAKSSCMSGAAELLGINKMTRYITHSNMCVEQDNLMGPFFWAKISSSNWLSNAWKIVEDKYVMGDGLNL